MKVVLASACGRPSVLIVNALTNYLYHEWFGVLILASNEYKGGTLVIFHYKEFGDSVADEKWVMDKGMLRVLFKTRVKNLV